MSKLMEKEVHNAAVNGDLTIFSKKNAEQLLNKTYQNNNIIHIAAQHKQINFIKAALNSFPRIPTCESLICEENCHGNTPFHIAAEVGDESVNDHLFDFFSTQCGRNRVFPWRMVNSKGNTPAHIALIYGKGSVAMYLVEKDDSVARVTNHFKETLLHLAIQYHVFDDPETEAISSSKENVLPIIELLLKIESSLACWANSDGLTALHLAASLVPVYCIPVIKTMLASCPEAAAIRDESSEHTILHLLTNHQVASYEQGLELMRIPEVYALINSKDHQGDTPLHLAARNCDRIMVRVLLEFSPNLGLKNKSGVSLRSLHPQLLQMRASPVEHKRKLTEEECHAALLGRVAFLKEQLVSLGITFLVSQTSTGGNILHLLLTYTQHSDNLDRADEFIGQAIQMLPSVISHQDRDGNTFVHLLAKMRFISSTILNVVYKYFNKVREQAKYDDAIDGLHLPTPWRMKNVKGDMPFHVAIKATNYDCALRLLEIDEEVADYVHNRNQNPLHLISRHNGIFIDGDDLDRLIKSLVIVNADLPYMRDEDGLTPLLVAVREGCATMIRKLWSQFPRCQIIDDFKGRSFWHLYVCQPVEQNRHSNFEMSEPDDGMLRFVTQQQHNVDDSESFRNLMAIKDNYKNDLLYYAKTCIRGLMTIQDNDGNTPLHLAITNRHFSFARFILDNWAENMYTRDQYNMLLSVENKTGVSSYTLIGSADHLPRQLERNLFSNGNLLYGHRSMYGVPTTKIEAYANTIGVIAALLATITFTAAFAVPGGLDNSNGTPFFLRKPMFQVFLVADVVAMCSSMMVLFCLLWIMTTTNKANSISLLDVSVFLLQTSFHATIVTFMTGLYVTTISIVPAIAITTCVACTLLIILMHNRLVMFTVVPFFERLIYWGHFVGRLFRK